MRNIAYATDPKPALQPLPIDPRQVAHQEKCRQQRLGHLGQGRKFLMMKTAKRMERVRALLMDGPHLFRDLHEAMGSPIKDSRIVVRRMRELGQIVCDERRLWRLVKS